MKGSFEKRKKKKHPPAHHDMKADRTFGFLMKGNKFEPKLFETNKGYEAPNVFLLRPLIRCPLSINGLKELNQMGKDVFAIWVQRTVKSM